MNKLKPCPFCGSTDIRLIEGDEYCWCMNQRCPIYDYEIRIDKWEFRADSSDLANLREQLSDYEEAVKSRDTLVRQLDVIWNGEAGAAKQASLCDIVSQLEGEVPALREQVRVLREALDDAVRHLNWIGYGDSYERECAGESGLIDRLESALDQTKPKDGE